jgi:dUTPase
MRVAQIVLTRAEEVTFAEVEVLEAATDGRGEGGFGSSGS